MQAEVKNFFKYLFICLCQLLVIAHEPLVAGCGIYFPDQGLNPGPRHWELVVLATGPPGKSQTSKAKDVLTSLSLRF